MNYKAIVDSLKSHEGIKLTMYTCAAGKPTIGVGHNLERPISTKAAEQILSDDIDDCVAALDRSLPWWRTLDDVRQGVVVEMVFNIGISRVLGFQKMIFSLKAREFGAAAAEMLASKWAKQVGKRAITLAKRMETGKQ